MNSSFHLSKLIENQEIPLPPLIGSNMKNLACHEVLLDDQEEEIILHWLVQINSTQKEETSPISTSSSDSPNSPPLNLIFHNSFGLRLHHRKDWDVKPKRKRADSFQLQLLQQVFRITKFPSTAVRLELAKLLKMSPRAVQIWFQNQRQTKKEIVNDAQETQDANLSIQTIRSIYDSMMGAEQ